MEEGETQLMIRELRWLGNLKRASVPYEAPL